MLCIFGSHTEGGSSCRTPGDGIAGAMMQTVSVRMNQFGSVMREGVPGSGPLWKRHKCGFHVSLRKRSRLVKPGC